MFSFHKSPSICCRFISIFTIWIRPFYRFRYLDELQTQYTNTDIELSYAEEANRLIASGNKNHIIFTTESLPNNMYPFVCNVLYQVSACKPYSLQQRCRGMFLSRNKLAKIVYVSDNAYCWANIYICTTKLFESLFSAPT